MHRSTLLTAAAILFAAPATAAAKGTIAGGPIKVKGGYTGTLIAVDNGRQDSVMIMLSKASKKSMQTHNYSFSTGMTVTSTSIKGSLGKYGKLNLRLSGAKTTTGKLPKGCTGTVGKTRVGTLTGTFQLKADTNYFKTIKATKLTGAASGSGTKLNCSGAGSNDEGDASGDGNATSGPMLMLSGQTPQGPLFFQATPSHQTASVTEDAQKTAPASISHAVTAVGTGLIVQPAGAQVPALGTVFGGSGTFTATGGSTAGPFVPGVVTGNLVAKFDSIGQAAIAGDATLMTGV